MSLVLLDRDGVLNEDSPDFIRSPADLRMLPGAAEAVARLNRAGRPVALVSNQSAVGRGLIDEAMHARIHETLRDHLARAGARIDLALYCFDPPWAATDRRKPGPGMVREALGHFRMSPQSAVMIGDSLRDLQAARAAGVARLLVRTGNGAATLAAGVGTVLPVRVYDDLAGAVQALLEGEAQT